MIHGEEVEGKVGAQEHRTGTSQHGGSPAGTFPFSAICTIAAADIILQGWGASLQPQSTPKHCHNTMTKMFVDLCTRLIYCSVRSYFDKA